MAGPVEQSRTIKESVGCTSRATNVQRASANRGQRRTTAVTRRPEPKAAIRALTSAYTRSVEGGQGRGRTADLPLFRTHVSAAQTGCEARTCVHRATSSGSALLAGLLRPPGPQAVAKPSGVRGLRCSAYRCRFVLRLGKFLCPTRRHEELPLTVHVWA